MSLVTGQVYRLLGLDAVPVQGQEPLHRPRRERTAGPQVKRATTLYRAQMPRSLVRNSQANSIIHAWIWNICRPPCSKANEKFIFVKKLF